MFAGFGIWPSSTNTIRYGLRKAAGAGKHFVISKELYSTRICQLKYKNIKKIFVVTFYIRSVYEYLHSIYLIRIKK